MDKIEQKPKIEDIEGQISGKQLEAVLGGKGDLTAPEQKPLTDGRDIKDAVEFAPGGAEKTPEQHVGEAQEALPAEVSRKAQLKPIDANARAELVRINAEKNGAKKGSMFESWAKNHLFGDQQRLTVKPENNTHLIDLDEGELGLAHRRQSDFFVSEYGDVWDAKAGYTHSEVDWDQAVDYSAMERAGYVYDINNNRVEINSVNYLFSSKEAAAHNALSCEDAGVWYLTPNGEVELYDLRKERP